MNQQSPHYDLRFEPWIPVERLDGTTGSLSIREALVGAHRVRRIAGEIPGESLALLRLLLAFVYRIYALPEEWGERARAGLCRRARAPRSVQLIWQHPEQAFDPRLTLAASLAEGVAGGRRLSRGEALSLIESSELVERFEVRPAWLDRLPHELSGGELMRLAIVRALLTEPRYLICDEMTASLDALAQAQIWRETLALADERGMGLIVVSHSPALLARVSTRAVSLA